MYNIVYFSVPAKVQGTLGNKSDSTALSIDNFVEIQRQIGTRLFQKQRPQLQAEHQQGKKGRPGIIQRCQNKCRVAKS